MRKAIVLGLGSIVALGGCFVLGDLGTDLKPGTAGGASKPPSCGAGLLTCGIGGADDCCESRLVTGGTYNRGNNATYPATVGDFRLDRFEITVGRFRKFVEAYPGNKPLSGAGAHPKIQGSGWDSTWDASLPLDEAALKTAVKCDASSNQTWTDTAGENENLPMNCINWFEAFAFCAWDGGRLPTEAEWNYAATGGPLQREYPWSNPPNSTTIDATYAVYECTGDGSAASNCAFGDILKVGSKSTKGDGEWGQADLGGSMHEWVLDWYNPTYPKPCDNCANVTNALTRIIRGGSWFDKDASSLLSSARGFLAPTSRYNIIGTRCARTP
jgi:formylglycine-generating enzyme required for sulfatase activity